MTISLFWSVYQIRRKKNFLAISSGYGIFRAYSGAGLGLALLKEKVTVPGFECNRTKADLGYNVTLVGMSLGGESFRYFCEWNAGCKSMLTAGLLVRF